MAESAVGTCDVTVLNLDQTCRSRLPKPLKSDRQRRLTLSQQTTRIQNNAEAHLKFPQLEMTKHVSSYSQSKIPQPSSSFKNNNVVNWLKLRPKTSVDTNSHRRAYTATERRNHYHQQLKSIEGSNSRRNSSEEHKFGKFTALPAIGMSRPNTADTSQSPALENSDIIANTEFINIDFTSNTNVNIITSSETETTENEQLNEHADEWNIATGCKAELTPDTYLDETSRPLIRSETYDILPTLHEEEDSNVSDGLEIGDSDNEQNNLATIHLTASTLSSNENAKNNERNTNDQLELEGNNGTYNNTSEN
ncbi:hypothetical protein CHUAL_000911 [Chamberlinius hualienensis]